MGTVSEEFTKVHELFLEELVAIKRALPPAHSYVPSGDNASLELANSDACVPDEFMQHLTQLGVDTVIQPVVRENSTRIQN